jgi:hypothetical protein
MDTNETCSLIFVEIVLEGDAMNEYAGMDFLDEGYEIEHCGRRMGISHSMP